MKTPLKILVPLDFSNYSQETLDFALSLKDHFSASYGLLHVVAAGDVENFSNLGLPPDEVLAGRVEAAREKLEQQASACRQRLPGVEVSVSVLAGVPYKEICSFADEQNFQMIVIGTHGRTGLSHLLIGSTTERVVQHSSCPVLSIKPRIV